MRGPEKRTPTPFGGSVTYQANSFYLTGSGAYDFGHGTVNDNVNLAEGSFNNHGYGVDLRAGNVFMLVNTINSGGGGAVITKAPRTPTSGYVVGLDVSGHVGYRDERSDGFTDSTGVVFGTEDVKYTAAGARAKLFAFVPSNGLMWIPYVSGTVDKQFGYSHVSNIAAQTVLPGGDVINFDQATTFWGGNAGIGVRGPGGWTATVSGFFSHSSDTDVYGGRLALSIPLYWPATNSRY